MVLALSFDLAATSPSAEVQPAAPATAADIDWRWIFDGDSDSLVGWCVGAAEGTRGTDGSRNPAYYGHTDPGNRVWNLGTFSWQHGADSPEQADAKQLARLRSQMELQDQQAKSYGLEMTLEQRLQGGDLANQSPLSGIGGSKSRGYTALLTDATLAGLTGDDAILSARVKSYINPLSGRWNAPGLGNSLESVTRDQARRQKACKTAIASYMINGPHRTQSQAQEVAAEPVEAQPKDDLGAISFELP